jgi:hypothetical protein
VSVGVGMSSGLSQYMCEVSPATLGSESEVESNVVARSVALLSKAFLVPVAAVRHSLARPDFEPARRSPSLWLLTTVRAEASAVGEGVEAEEEAGDGVLPTQRRHSRALPRARSQQPISRGGRPESFAQA